VVAVAGGTAATVQARADAEYEAQGAVRLQLPQPMGRAMGEPFRLLDEPERLLNVPEVRELVRLRLGETPPLQVKPVTNDTILVRSRGPTPQQAVHATSTYAASYLDVRRRQSDAALAAAAASIQDKIDTLQAKLDSTEEPQRAHVVEALGLFTKKLDQLHAEHAATQGHEVVGSGPAEPVDNGTGGHGSWLRLAQLSASAPPALLAEPAPPCPQEAARWTSKPRSVMRRSRVALSSAAEAHLFLDWADG